MRKSLIIIIIVSTIILLGIFIFEINKPTHKTIKLKSFLNITPIENSSTSKPNYQIHPTPIKEPAINISTPPVENHPISKPTYSIHSTPIKEPTINISTPPTQKNSITTHYYMTTAQLYLTNKTQNCVYTDLSSNSQIKGTIYMHNKMFRGYIKKTGGNYEDINEIIKNGTVYIWVDSGNWPVFKVPLLEMETGKTSTGQTSALEVSKENFSCKPWIPDDSKFILPNLQFTDLTQLLNQVSKIGEVTIPTGSNLRKIFSSNALRCTFTDNSKAPKVVTKVSLYGADGNIHGNYDTTITTTETKTWDNKIMMYKDNVLYELDTDTSQKMSITPEQFDQMSSIFYNPKNIKDLVCKTDIANGQNFELPINSPKPQEVSKFTIF